MNTGEVMIVVVVIILVISIVVGRAQQRRLRDNAQVERTRQK